MPLLFRRREIFSELPTDKDSDSLRQTNSARLAALQHRELPLLGYGKIFTSTATCMDFIARGWLIYELTHSSF